jgi:hypothetical protein
MDSAKSRKKQIQDLGTVYLASQLVVKLRAVSNGMVAPTPLDAEN